VYLLRDSYISTIKKRQLFPSQREFSNAIIRSVLFNRGDIILAMWTRQHGKTTGTVDTVDFLFEFYFPLCTQLGLSHYPFFNVGFFAPQQQQSRTAFTMLKESLLLAQHHTFPVSFDTFNGDTIIVKHTTDVEYPPRQAYCFTASPSSHPESKTLNLIIYDESQDLEDIQVEKAIEPMGASTNATQVFIGVGGYKRCKFWKLAQQLEPQYKFIIDVNKALEERELLYQQTHNLIYRNYKAHIDKKMRMEGVTEESDHYKTQYLLKWILERGQFITYEHLMSLEKDYEVCEEVTDMVYVGIDWGKIHDGTIVTYVNELARVQEWLEFLGDDYNSQIEDIALHTSKKYRKVGLIHCDSTGTQDMGVDNLRRRLREHGVSTQVIGVPFTAQSKDAMYKNLWRLMSPVVSGGQKLQEAAFAFPKKAPPAKKEKFIKQFLDLQKEMKNEKWSCNHPEGPQYHDDYCDSAALACYAFKPNAVPQKHRFQMFV